MSSIHEHAGKLADPSALVDISELITAYFTLQPEPDQPTQQVAFGTSGHRGMALQRSFNEWHVLAMTQALCDYRVQQHIDGPLFVGIDTHALSTPAFASTMEVLAANGVTTMIPAGKQYTPTPAVSHAILCHNRGRAPGASGAADGVVITPSHNPPDNGGYKYNSPNGGPADTVVTRWIEQRANEYLEKRLAGVRRISFDGALRAATTHHYDFLGRYVDDLEAVIDMEVIRSSGIVLGVDPLGGAGVAYWERIADQYRLHLDVVNRVVDATFRFVPQDWDGQIRMDPSSPYAMSGLIGMKSRFDVSFACDADHDRHGIVAKSSGLLPSNNYLAVAIDYLFRHRPDWRSDAGIGKTLVSSQLIDRVAARLGRPLVETPVGFKWFVDGLHDGSLGFGGEESAGACFLRKDGQAWSTDKDGITAALLSAEMTARTGRDPGETYLELTQQLGTPFNGRVDAPATPAQKKILSKLSPQDVDSTELAGEKIERILTTAPANQVPFGGLKIETANGWFAARPSGTENIYKIYAESFRDQAHLDKIFEQAQHIVTTTLKRQD
ncbi:phosphoglucomutase (alpha-D-glucose-1,6-bisphosphate-dependent) [Herbaspirillum sp. RTI4]|uniref:phosphoglucomutase (alpha-D-glucose-1,6-bisphosphate-dependent) n=1 Tax=Herbaspirillum sp. RTI4 TaxID=3048640 RepID=UPI002AB4DA54|nr:phosphoglucomutase (alpha-D-glucose-1,6-bisphosphate-dependent) [Herbaspirillum sp. RTI4]MDY7579058.1 phosphoglucomutase (alpha-D-glucose-1,6-bisphosphate-dependent) [Herbaspirillum sp. RTI4]MEA9982357.1 phosphoglucomutase (alpha-D-glucose-1,6-bisphosphate-dependent) [Herbaspirillum sp. RTI4]